MILFHTKFLWLLSLASIFNGVSWWVLLLDRSTFSPGILEIIQLGGTGGLVVALLGAVITLWKDRINLRKEWAEEVAQLRSLITKEREDHRQEILELHRTYKHDITELTSRYTEELKSQINLLRTEERVWADKRYEHKN